MEKQTYLARICVRFSSVFIRLFDRPREARKNMTDLTIRVHRTIGRKKIDDEKREISNPSVIKPIGRPIKRVN